MAGLVKVLESYRGKDRTIRLFTYVFMSLGGKGNTPWQAKCRKIVTELGACRTVLRLFDDFSMLMLNLSTGFGMKEPNPWLRPLEVLSGILNQLYYAVEHVAWLRDKAVIPGNSAIFWLLSIVTWASTLFTEIIKCLVKLRVNAAKTRHLKKQKYLEKTEDRESNSQQIQQIEESIAKLAFEQRDTVLLLIQSAADLANAVSWLPKGFLWSQKLHPSANGVFGLVSTSLMLYRNWPSQ